MLMEELGILASECIFSYPCVLPCILSKASSRTVYVCACPSLCMCVCLCMCPSVCVCVLAPGAKQLRLRLNRNGMSTKTKHLPRTPQWMSEREEKTLPSREGEREGVWGCVCVKDSVELLKLLLTRKQRLGVQSFKQEEEYRLREYRRYSAQWKMSQ